MLSPYFINDFFSKLKLGVSKLYLEGNAFGNQTDP